MMRLKSISEELGLLFLLVAMAPILTAIIVANNIFSHSIQNEKSEELAAIADSTQARAESYVLGLIHDATSLAKSPNLISLLKSPEHVVSPPVDVYEFLRAFTVEKGYYDLLLIDLHGDIRFSFRRGKDLGQNINGDDLKETQLAETINAANTLLQTEVSNFSFYPPSNSYTAFLAAPIFEQGVIVGNVVLLIDNRELNNIVNRFGGLGESGEILTATQENGSLIITAPARHDDNLHTRLIDPARFAPLQSALRGESGAGQYLDYRGHDTLSVWRYLPSLNWGMLVKVDTQELNAPIQRFERISLLVMLASILLVVVGIILSNRIVSRPIVRLAQIVHAFKQEALPETIHMLARHEIGELVTAFNVLIATVRSHQLKLEERVAQRTSELADVNQRAKSAFESALDAIVQINTAGIITVWSGKAEQIFGWRKKEALGRLVHEIIIPHRYQGRHLQGLAHFLSTGEGSVLNKRIELFALRRNGEEFPIELSITPIKTFSGYEFNAFIRDLSEQRKLESAQRIAAIAFETHEAIMITDPDAKIIRVNSAFQKITGYSSDEVIDKYPRMLKSGKHDMAFYQEMWSTLKKTGFWSGEVWDRRKSGEIYPKFLTITAVYNDDRQATNYVAVFRDITLHKQTEQEIHQLAFYDPLTQLPNRRLMMDRLKQAMAISQRSNRYGALLFLDLDNFKSINDTKGHEVGDLLLIEVARRLQTCVRKADTVARQGGDEFVVLLEELSSDPKEAATQTELVAEKICSELGQLYVLNDYECQTTPSIGISLFHGYQENMAELLKHADVAMYQAKAAGRNTIRFFDPEMQAILDNRAELQAEMIQALQRQQFRLYYQVQVDNRNCPVGAEVLLRWEHPKHGLILPNRFIPLAEDIGLIVPLGLWVLETACAQLKIWQNEASACGLTLAVNVSSKQFRQPDFVAKVQQAILANDINPSRLKLEMTESIVLENVEDTIAKMLELKLLGISFSMDDFGVGYSSLSYLKRLPLNQIKIDQSFVRDITSDPNDAAIVQTIIEMTKTLGLSVIAEGVETEAQRKSLDMRGCHFFQGYLFSKPVPIELFEKLLKKH
jgi:diguanylate cyclase (GGDEF)-like protein/PAS domain S-box-containing protein